MNLQLIAKNDMNVSSNIEFYTYEHEVWFRTADGHSERLMERHHDVVEMLLEKIEQFYPAAYAALCNEYQRLQGNLSLYRFRMVQRFAKCNFGVIDNIPDIDSYGKLNLECVPCPLRGECRHEGVICRPDFDSKISDAEMRVLKLWYNGLTKEEIAEELYLSIHTVNNHIRNAFTRLGIHEKAEFFRYASQNHLFHEPTL